MLNKNYLITAICFLYLCPGVSFGQLYFNPTALKLDPNDTSNNYVDLSSYESSIFPPGNYHSQVYINNNYVGDKYINYNVVDGSLTPVLTKKDLSDWGIAVSLLPALKGYPDNKSIDSITKSIPDFKSEYNLNEERLDIKIPQLYIKSSADIDAPRDLWDQGIPAIFTNYNINALRSESDQGLDSSLYLSLNSGLNIGAWRLRNNSNYTENRSGDGHFSALTNYLQRDIQPLGAQFQVGRVSSSPALFDSTLVDGVQLYSDTDMLPYSQQGFAPVIRGIARSDAQVTVKQNGYIIYQTSVPAGPFALTDISSLTNGNLLVTVREADGSEHSFNQFFATVPGMQREGHLRFSSSFGKYLSSTSGGNDPYFLQYDLSYGVNNNFTPYSGMQVASNYTSLLGGAAVGLMDLGSISGDITFAHSKLTNGDNDNGESLRVQYAKALDDTGTNLTLAGYRYSTSGFYSFSEANDLTSGKSDSDFSIGNNKKSRAQVQINQYLDKFGGVALTAYYQNYWNSDRLEKNYSLSYNTSIKNIFLNLNFMHSKISGSSASDNILSLNASVPLEKFLPSSWVGYGMTSNSHGVTNNLSLYGNIEHDPSWSYDVRSYHNSQPSGSGGAVSVSHNTHYGTLSGGYSYDPQYRQTNFNAAGGIVLHSDGITFSQPLGDSFAIIHTNGARNIKINDQEGVYTDGQGNAIVPYLTTYHKNKISLDTETIPDDFDFDNLITTVVPTKGAIVRADFGGLRGYQAFIHLTHNGSAIPFGTTVSLKSNGNVTGIVDEKGVVYLKGLPSQGRLNLKWGVQSGQQCSANYRINNKEVTMQYLDMVCH